MNTMDQAKEHLRKICRLIGRLDLGTVDSTLAAQIEQWCGEISASGLLTDQGPILDAAMGYVIVRPIGSTPREPSPSGREPLWIAVVVSVGPDIMDYRVGDRVAYSRYSGFDLLEDRVVLDRREIRAIVHESAP